MFCRFGHNGRVRESGIKYEQQLKARTEELEQSHQELQQFDCVASHDLQEPLRTVVGFCQLLEMGYSELVDDAGKMYLETIVDGGKRMQRLISDLLEYSRVGRKGNPRENTSLLPLRLCSGSTRP